MGAKGKLYLIPVPISEGALATLSENVKTVTADIKFYFSERARTSRRFLRSLHPDLILEDIQFSEIDKHEGIDFNTLKKWLSAGHDVGVMSEAGCPGVADPGAKIVKAAHNIGAEVIPIVGPNSIILALMASGLNGQSFAFNGYLPVKEPARSKQIKYLELRSRKEKQTQIFIETPYRNKALHSELLKNCHDNTHLCIAQNITAENASIVTNSIAYWKKNPVKFEKQPVVFLILAQ